MGCWSEPTLKLRVLWTLQITGQQPLCLRKYFVPATYADRRVLLCDFQHNRYDDVPMSWERLTTVVPLS